jgi:hypothetical protein
MGGPALGALALSLTARRRGHDRHTPGMPDARREAFDAVEGRYEVRVLEPSSPAVDGPPWFGDDPTARGDVPGRTVLSPVTTGDLLWEELAEREPGLATFCAERWLGAYRPLDPPPRAFVTTRDGLHRLAEHLLAATRARANGRHALRWTRGGFGTPYFGADAQLRVEGDALVLEVGGTEHRGRLTSLRDAAEFVGFDITRFDVEDDASPLGVEDQAARWIGDWLGLGCSILEQLRAETNSPATVPPVELDPGAFELRLQLGRGRTCAWGLGDARREPRLRVRDHELRLTTLLDARDQRRSALAFARESV